MTAHGLGTGRTCIEPREIVLTSPNDSRLANWSMGIALGLAMAMYLGGLGISAGQTLQSAAGPSAPMVALWPPEQFLQPVKPVIDGVNRKPSSPRRASRPFCSPTDWSWRERKHRAEFTATLREIGWER